ncbi:MAG: hypothetical protein HC849_12975 [Oscillatoriales cyanobacterium RU_3_3]|nr:hypothetical protein [Microcoleus sp. SU_5_6]NJM60907.1 hypothetical protein [Oscillatoriales cyanobacterium RU_3_3]NJR21743.1 hypothetical protein [Richelia sp. CSU_2_1]
MLNLTSVKELRSAWRFESSIGLQDTMLMLKSRSCSSIEPLLRGQTP